MEDCGNQLFRHQSFKCHGLDPNDGTSICFPPRHIAKMHTLKIKVQSGTVASKGHLDGAAGLVLDASRKVRS